MSDQPFAEASTYTGQHNRQTSMPLVGFEPAAADLRLRPCGHWDQPNTHYTKLIFSLKDHSNYKKMSVYTSVSNYHFHIEVNAVYSVTYTVTVATNLDK
jgi:hypothetical protein